MDRCARVLVASLALLFAASPVAATPQSDDFFFSGEIIGGDNPGYVVKAHANFSYDDECVGNATTKCELTITLTALTTGSGAVPSQGEVLTALVFDVLGGADFRAGPPGIAPWPGGTAGTSKLIGSGNALATANLGFLDPPTNTVIDVSGHWGLNPAISVPNHGTHALSSVGDLFVGSPGGNATVGAVHILDNTTQSNLELLPPNGSLFGIVDANSTVGGSGFPMSDLAYIQDQLTATLLYNNPPTGLDNVEPLYGTEGLPIPEPSTAVLMGFGLLGLLGGLRRLHGRG
jgi:hypothetical protein